MTIPKQLLEAKICNKNTCELNQRIDKAIEYIEKVESVNKELKDTDMYWAYNTFFPELLDILKGSDKE